MEGEMWDAARSFVAEHRDVSKLVEDAERFSIRLPVIGRVGVPRPDQLAFYGALGLLAAIEVIDWPVALLLGAGHAVAVRHLNGEAPRAVTAQRQKRRKTALRKTFRCRHRRRADGRWPGVT
ncbi:hypothetical protein M4D79_06820 [Mycolicibacterium novocastrense]|nr:hypothetical protein M4D79_06820 [Mycolicibacterium novocastrense]